MGRPLNKKYFGNRNFGVAGDQTAGGNSNNQNYSDDNIGGEGFSGVTFSAAVLNTSYGTGKYLDRKPTITVPAPTIPGGVQAVASVTNVQAVAALSNNKGTGYQIGDIVVGTTGTGTKARFRVTKVRVLSVAISDQANSSQFDGGENLVWDSLVDDNWTSPTILRTVTSTGAPNYDLGATSTPYNVGTSTFGVWDGYLGGVQALAPTTLTITGGGNGFNTRGNGDTNGPATPGLDNNGAGGTATFTYGIEAVEVVSGYQGDYTVVDASAQAVTNVSGSGASATLDIFYGVKTITVTERGSGYTGEEAVTFSVTTDGAEVRATGTMVLTTDTGAVGSATNQENAIIIHANTGNEGDMIGDIIRQVSTRRYKVRADGIAICELVADDTPAYKKAYIKATDDNGNTYFVMKLTAKRATLMQWTNNEADWLFNDNDVAHWVFSDTDNSYDATTSVVIENA